MRYQKASDNTEGGPSGYSVADQGEPYTQVNTYMWMYTLNGTFAHFYCWQVQQAQHYSDFPVYIAIARLIVHVLWLADGLGEQL